MQKLEFKLYISTPCYGGVCLTNFAQSMLKLQDTCIKIGLQMTFDTIENESLVHRARNCAVGRFMQVTDFSHFMFIDADVEFSVEGIMKLLSVDKDVAVAIYPKKVIMWDDAAKALINHDDRPIEYLSSSLVVNYKHSGKVAVINNMVSILDGPTGFMLIKRDVFERMEKHYPELLCKNDHQHRTIETYHAVFDCMIDPDSKRYLSEDYAFCRRWQQMGGEIWADIMNPLGHVGTLSFEACLNDRLKNEKTHINNK